jgi:DNA-directed RNA polymerase beta' subunit
MVEKDNNHHKAMLSIARKLNYKYKTCEKVLYNNSIVKITDLKQYKPMVDCECTICGKKFIDTFRSNGEYLCDDCAKEKSKKSLTRPFTEETEYLICLWTYQGDSDKDIASVLHRDINVIRDTIATCKANGKFDNYVKFLEDAEKDAAMGYHNGIYGVTHSVAL